MVDDTKIMSPRNDAGTAVVARPHMEQLVARTRESSSVAQLDGSDIVYVARVAVPKIVTLAVTIGTRFPALPTSLGKALLAALQTAGAISADWAACQAAPQVVKAGDGRVSAERTG